MEINVMSLMEQLNRGHSATLSNHSEDKLRMIANQIEQFYFKYMPYDYDYAKSDDNDFAYNNIVSDAGEMLRMMEEYANDSDMQSAANEIIKELKTII